MTNNSDTKTFGNYSEALGQLICLTIYSKKGDEKGFLHVSELVVHRELEMALSKLKLKQTSIL